MAIHVQEFRLMLYVRDLITTRAFYERVFNWPITTEWEAGVMYDTGAAIFELLQSDEAEEPNNSMAVSIRVADVWSLFENFKDSVTLVFPLRDNSWGDTSFQISDPNGFKITLFTKTKNHL